MKARERILGPEKTSGRFHAPANQKGTKRHSTKAEKGYISTDEKQSKSRGEKRGKVKNQEHSKAGTSHRSVAQRFPHRVFSPFLPPPCSPPPIKPRRKKSFPFSKMPKKRHRNPHVVSNIATQPLNQPLYPHTPRNKAHNMLGNPAKDATKGRRKLYGRSTPTHRSVLALTLSSPLPTDKSPLQV